MLSGPYDWWSPFQCPRLILLLKSKLKFSTSFALFLSNFSMFSYVPYHFLSLQLCWSIFQGEFGFCYLLSLFQTFFFTCRLHWTIMARLLLKNRILFRLWKKSLPLSKWFEKFHLSMENNLENSTSYCEFLEGRD